MKIISGTHKGLKLTSSNEIRPTTGIVREAVFNILMHSGYKNFVSDAVVLDLFCGTGAMSFESLSRGAKKAIMVDLNLHIAKLNAQKFSFDNIKMLCKDVCFLPKIDESINLIFADPPYNKNFHSKTLDVISKSISLSSDALIVLESHVNEKFLVNSAFYQLLMERRYGNTKISFFSCVGSDVAI